eukprot:CAMPEP_0194228664 /NCGR_PEP_ID=MMETSP0156-20130528/43486_1 /TAXON_ID=33649 /ORGANISM="Thalassionema nitzschioides, Strain L26-B" /LENGTH=616 /DNA_ID=CAMNT_0038961183 /DNA_START=122 /DNA_END=1972 /DNA_ORIENTATION=-
MRCSKPSLTEKDPFVARPSTHVSLEETKGDGDTWQETLAVCEMGGKLTIRSYYTNRRTDEKKWDEPPSGASKVMNATDTMRRMANIQLTEMQIATGSYKDPEKSNTAKKNKGVFGSLFRRGKNEQNSGEQTKPRIQYKPDSFIGKTKRQSKKSNEFDESLNPAMQSALASSLASVNENERTNDFEAPADDGVDFAMDPSNLDQEQSLEFTTALQSGPFPPDPPESQNSALGDGSVVLHEVNFTEEEALEMALKLSLAETEKQSDLQPTNEPKRSPDIGVASMPKLSENLVEKGLKIEETDDARSDRKPEALLAENSKMPLVPAASILSDAKSVNVEQKADDGALPDKESQGEQHFIFGGAQNTTAGKKENPRKTQSDKSRQRRRLTPEELAAKEERMIQRAINESIKNSQDASTTLEKTEEDEKGKLHSMNKDSRNETESSMSGQDSSTAHLKHGSADSLSRNIANRDQDPTIEKKDNRHKSHHGKNRQRRRLTKEELAAKEEKMLQRALKESMKESENNSPSRGRTLEREEGIETSQHSSHSSERKASRSPGPRSRPPLSPGRSRSPMRARDVSRAQPGRQKEKKRSKNRGLTPEELAAKEEEMFQKALKASLEE